MHTDSLPVDTATTTSGRRILVCATGLSPQIVTETLFALAVASPTPWIPDEIRLITTQRGADNARLTLLSEQPGWFHRLLKDWNLPAIAFDAAHIEVLRDSTGHVLDDIRDDHDNRCAADGIANLIRRLTQDEHGEIHASIAGGRKTMGFFMGYAMSLWGRPQDKLSHVLVSAPFESRPEFFYPTPTAQVIPARAPGQDPLDASTAKVWLGDIPFVRLRSLLPGSLKGENTSFAQAVSVANRVLDQIDLEIDISASCVRINQQPIALPPMQFALLCVLAWRCQQKRPPLTAPVKGADDPEWKRQVRQDLQHAMGDMHIPGSLDDRLNDSKAIDETFSQQLSKMEKTLRNSGLLPLRGLIERQNQAMNSRQTGYSLLLQPAQIRFIRP